MVKDKTMRKQFFLTAMFALILTSSAWASDISGNWTLTMWGAGAEESVPVVFQADGGNLTVTCTHPAFKEMTGTGTLKGDAIAFNLKSSAMEIAFTGKVDGNKMQGLREITGSGGGGQGGAPGGDAPKGGMPDGAGGPQGGQGAPDASQGAPGGAQGAPQGMAEQGGDSQESSEAWGAVKN
jgi:hypothetical protein